MRRRLTIFQSLRRRRHRTTSHLVTHPARAGVRGRSRGASETPAVTETAVDINCAKPSATQKARIFGFGIEHVRVHSCIRALVAAVLSDVRLIKAAINAPSSCQSYDDRTERSFYDSRERPGATFRRRRNPTNPARLKSDERSMRSIPDRSEFGAAAELIAPKSSDSETTRFKRERNLQIFACVGSSRSSDLQYSRNGEPRKRRGGTKGYNFRRRAVSGYGCNGGKSRGASVQVATGGVARERDGKTAADIWLVIRARVFPRAKTANIYLRAPGNYAN